MEKESYLSGLLFAPKIKNLMKIMEDLFLMKIHVLDQRLKLLKKTIELGKAYDSINKLISERHELQSAVHRNNVNSLVRKLDSLEDLSLIHI